MPNRAIGSILMLILAFAGCMPSSSEALRRLEECRVEYEAAQSELATYRHECSTHSKPEDDQHIASLARRMNQAEQAYNAELAIVRQFQKERR